MLPQWFFALILFSWFTSLSVSGLGIGRLVRVSGRRQRHSSVGLESRLRSHVFRNDSLRLFGGIWAPFHAQKTSGGFGN